MAGCGRRTLAHSQIQVHAVKALERISDGAASIALACLALLASGIGLWNQYAYDDRYIVAFNTRVHGLHGWWHLFAQSYWPVNAGGDGYRPFTMLAFAVEWVIGGGAPMVFHAVNIALYLAVTVLVFRLGLLILPRWAAWAAAALFAVHPVHVEAVANVVGQSELWVAVFVLPAVILYVRARRRGGLATREMIAVAALYALACFAKEHGIVLPALLLAAELTLVPDTRPLRQRAREMRPFILGLGAIAVAFLAAHTAVLSRNGITGFNEFVPFQALSLSTRDRVLTMFGVVPQWIRLFYWPAKLRSEYAPPDIDIAQGFSLIQVPGMLLLAGILGVAATLWRRRPVVSFGIAWIVITLLPSSNFLVPAGIILAERTLFLPSVGAMIILADGLVLLAPYARTASIRMAAAGALALLLIAGAARSVNRTPVWHDNQALFTQAVADAPDSYRAHYMLGEWEFENKRRDSGRREYHVAFKLFPYDPYLTLNMASEYANDGVCGVAVGLFKWTYGVGPAIRAGRTQFARCLLEMARFSEGRRAAMTALRYIPSEYPTLHRIVVASDSALADSVRQPPVLQAGTGRKVPDSGQKTAR